MNKKLGVGILIVAFSCSNVNFVFASGVVDVAPIIVQPYSLQGLSQQGLDQDRINRDEEIEIQNLVEENKKLIQDVLAGKQDQGLAKINQTMSDYDDALYSRDQARILANGQRVSPRYASLVALTEDADAMTQDRGDLAAKDALLAQKYQMLTQLKDEMVTLNDKLRNQDAAVLNKKEKIIDAYKDLVQDQQGKIQLLVERLSQMDKKIAGFDAIISAKDQQIALLKSNLAEAQNEAAENKDQKSAYTNLQAQIASLKSQIMDQVDDLKAKDQMLKEQADQIALLQKQPKSAPSSPIAPIIVNGQQANTDQDEIIREKNTIIKEQGDEIASLQNQPKAAVSSPVAPVIVNQQANTNQDEIIREKNAIIKQQSDQLSQSSQQMKDQTAQYAQVQDEITGLRNRLHQEDLDLQAKNDSLRWLNQVVSAAKQKAEYYKLTSDKDRMSLQQVQGEIAGIKGDFARQLKDYSQFDTTIVDLRGQVGRLTQQLSDKQNQVDLLKSELENKITEESDQSQQQAQAQQDLKAQLQDKEDQINTLKEKIQAVQADQANKEMVLQNATAQAQDRIKLAKQLIDLQQQEASLLDEKNSLVSTEGSSFEQRAHDLQDLISKVLAAHHNHVADLRNHLAQLKEELGQQENQVSTLNTNLQDKIAQLKDQTVLDYEITDLKNQVDHLNEQLQDRETQISILKAQLQSGQESQAQAEVLKNQLADEQNNVDALKQELDSKGSQINQATLTMDNYKSAQEKNQGALEAQVQDLKSQLQDSANMVADMRYQIQSGEQTGSQVDTLKQELGGQEDKLNMLEAALKTKIEEAKSQKVLEYQIQDLKSQLENKDNEIADIKARLQISQDSQTDYDGLKQQLSDALNNVEILKKELASKDAQNDQMTLMIADYQKKLESKNSAYNQELGHALTSKNDQAQMQEQISELNARLLEKEAQIVKIKKDMYDLKDTMNAKDQDMQAKDLSVSMAQQKLMDEKVKEFQEKADGLQAADKAQVQVIADLKAELALAQQKLGVVPSSDEIEFLQTGLKKATVQLHQKDLMLSQIKANAAEYTKEFKAQSQEFQSVKAQLQDALDEIDRKKEDLKYKNMELIRYKELATAKENDLQAQIKALGGKPATVIVGKPDLQAQLRSANDEIKGLQDKLNALSAPMKTDRLREKLQQALDKIDQQGRYINALVEKLHDAGQNVNLADLGATH